MMNSCHARACFTGVLCMPAAFEPGFFSGRAYKLIDGTRGV